VPRFTDEAAAALVARYKQLRRQGRTAQVGAGFRPLRLQSSLLPVPTYCDSPTSNPLLHKQATTNQPKQHPTAANRQVVVATPRQLEALIRLSEAWARMHLRELVTEADVTAAYNLWCAACSLLACAPPGAGFWLAEGVAVLEGGGRACTLQGPPRFLSLNTNQTPTEPTNQTNRLNHPPPHPTPTKV
jgi:hypothetical protein